MRPEFVTRYRIPLSPDGLSKRFKTPEDEEEIITATKYLWTAVISEAISAIEKNYAKKWDQLLLTRALHSYGINMRYLARVYNAANAPELKQLIFG